MYESTILFLPDINMIIVTLKCKLHYQTPGMLVYLSKNNLPFLGAKLAHFVLFDLSKWNTFSLQIYVTDQLTTAGPF